jgi:Na+/H+ antiporter NhaD/arsenite permease-like protein
MFVKVIAYLLAYFYDYQFFHKLYFPPSFASVIFFRQLLYIVLSAKEKYLMQNGDSHTDANADMRLHVFTAKCLSVVYRSS